MAAFSSWAGGAAGDATFVGDSRASSGVAAAALRESCLGGASDGGVAATATFDAAPGYELNRGMFYDVEVRSKNQAGAFLQVAALPEGKSIGEVADSFFTKKVFSTEGP